MDAGTVREAIETAVSDLQELNARLEREPELFAQIAERVQDAALTLSDQVDPDGPLGGE